MLKNSLNFLPISLIFLSFTKYIDVAPRPATYRLMRVQNGVINNITEENYTTIFFEMLDSRIYNLTSVDVSEPQFRCVPTPTKCIYICHFLTNCVKVFVSWAKGLCFLLSGGKGDLTIPKSDQKVFFQIYHDQTNPSHKKNRLFCSILTFAT
ncbi:hypothetical protein HELRODRAFT_177112 [Helobdella robusta]|uniref:Apple domain-containing protein n=1 Tax=Helobdella robusta TaxID=6412 RepID=T1FB87_HELRO|nr:hypothetical protein HELRODRAFT_177112 [Helobdella robusta]ESN98232.1 hypothetical protein HELRODRAFT_177112 [Helobdella robusta]